LLAVCALLLQGSGEAAKPAPTAEEVARAEATLDQAYRAGDAAGIAAALESARVVAHPTVVKKVLEGLADERREVQLDVLQTLRWMDHRDALEALHRLAKERKWMKVPELAAAILRGIGQHADPTSVAVLAREPFEPEDFACWRARIFGMARIHTL